MRLPLLVLPLLLAALAAPTQAEPAADPELAARITLLERLQGLDASVRRPLALAREALARAATARDPEAARRAQEIARTSVLLAEARHELLRERALLRSAEAHRTVAERDLKSAEHALARERARLAELTGPEAAP